MDAMFQKKDARIVREDQLSETVIMRMADNDYSARYVATLFIRAFGQEPTTERRYGLIAGSQRAIRSASFQSRAGLTKRSYAGSSTIGSVTHRRLTKALLWGSRT